MMTVSPGYAIWCSAPDLCDAFAFEEGVCPQDVRALAAEAGWVCDDPLDAEPNAKDYCPKHAHLTTRPDA